MKFKRKLGVVIGIIMVVALFLTYLVVFGAMRFADRFSMAEFRKINKGDSYDAVVNKLGMPISYSVIAEANESGESQQPCENTLFAHLADYTKTNKYCVIMEYSRPRCGNHYYAFQVLVLSNQVYETRNFYNYPP